MAQVIAIGIGAASYEFDVNNAEYNKFVNSMGGGKAVQAAFNFVIRTVKDEQRAELKSVLTDDENQPKSTLVMQIMGEITEAFTSDLPEVVKLQVTMPGSVSKTASSSS